MTDKEETISRKRSELFSRTAVIYNPKQRHMPESGQIGDRFSHLEEKYGGVQSNVPAKKIVAFLENEDRTARKLLDSGEDPLEVGMHCARFVHYFRAYYLRNADVVAAIQNRWSQPPLVFDLASSYDKARTALIKHCGMTSEQKQLSSSIVKEALIRPRIVVAATIPDTVIDYFFFQNKPLTREDKNSIAYAVSAAFALDGWLACESYTDDPKIVSCFGYYCYRWDVVPVAEDELKRLLHPELQSGKKKSGK